MEARGGRGGCRAAGGHGEDKGGEGGAWEGGWKDEGGEGGGGKVRRTAWSGERTKPSKQNNTTTGFHFLNFQKF